VCNTLVSCTVKHNSDDMWASHLTLLEAFLVILLSEGIDCHRSCWVFLYRFSCARQHIA